MCCALARSRSYRDSFSSLGGGACLAYRFGGEIPSPMNGSAFDVFEKSIYSFKFKSWLSGTRAFSADLRLFTGEIEGDSSPL